MLVRQPSKSEQSAPATHTRGSASAPRSARCIEKSHTRNWVRKATVGARAKGRFGEFITFYRIICMRKNPIRSQKITKKLQKNYRLISSEFCSAAEIAPLHG